jgi:hypothetical protein
MPILGAPIPKAIVALVGRRMQRVTRPERHAITAFDFVAHSYLSSAVVKSALVRNARNLLHEKPTFREVTHTEVAWRGVRAVTIFFRSQFVLPLAGCVSADPTCFSFS